MNINELNLELAVQNIAEKVSIYSNRRNSYRWIIVDNITKDKRLLDTPLFGLTKMKVDNNNFTYIASGKTYGYMCFGQFTHKIQVMQKQRYHRIVFTSIPNTIQINKQTNNHCWATLELINFWLEVAKEETGLDFYFNVRKVRNNHLNINFDFKELNFSQIKYILFWTRYLFEYPDSLCMLDAVLLKRDYFPEESLCNLLTLTATCQRYNRAVHIDPFQCISVNYQFITLDYLRNKLDSNNSISGIFALAESNRGIDRRLDKTPTAKKITGLYFKPKEDWINNIDRFQVYTANYKILKQHEQG